MGTPIMTSKKEIRVSEVRKVLETMIRAQEIGNWELFATCFAQNEQVVNIGTDLDEFWVGWNSFRQWMKEAIQQRKGCQIQEKNTQIEFSQDGKVAWYSQLIDTSVETKSDMIRIEGFRHTGVMEYLNNRWLIVQTHMSAPVLETPSQLLADNQFQYAF